MSKTETLHESAQRQAHLISAQKSEIARMIDEARDALASMVAQELSIRDSIRDSCNAIQESQILLMETD